MTQLSGMLAIRGYYNYSESTILKLIREMDFPAVKITGGIWESDTDLIDEWRLEKIKSESGIRRKGGFDHREALENKIKARGKTEENKLEKKLADIKKQAKAEAKKKAKAEAKKKVKADKKAKEKQVSSEKDQ